MQLSTLILLIPLADATPRLHRLLRNASMVHKRNMTESVTHEKGHISSDSNDSIHPMARHVGYNEETMDLVFFDGHVLELAMSMRTQSPSESPISPTDYLTFLLLYHLEAQFGLLPIIQLAINQTSCLQMHRPLIILCALRQVHQIALQVLVNCPQHNVKMILPIVTHLTREIMR